MGENYSIDTEEVTKMKESREGRLRIDFELELNIDKERELWYFSPGNTRYTREAQRKLRPIDTKEARDNVTST